MIGTLAGLALAILFYMTGLGKELPVENTFFGVLLLGIPLFMLGLSAIAWFTSWEPLQLAEQQQTSRILDLFRRDTSLRFTRVFFILFPLISLLILLDFWYLHLLRQDILLPMWVLLFGISMDLLNYIFRRISSYMDPFQMVKIFTHQANVSIQNDNDLEMFEKMDALAEMGIRAVDRSSVALSSSVANELQRMARIYLESSKSISRENKEVSGVDEVSYTLFFLLQRLELINEKAAERKLETICSTITGAVGKIIISAAKCDISLVSYPIHCLGRFALVAEQKGMLQIGTKATCTFVEVAKTILQEVDVTYAELEEPFCAMVKQMKELAKEMYRQDKSINLKLLSQPLRDLKELFSTDKMANHTDTPAILRCIDAALAEFDALESLLKAIPAIGPLQP